ncbi:PGF-CTERM sorting domain-containing protein [Haladaptatus cibarius]|uniref:PGF-CTERM sorting domain-containing protein n=1 Tax=Haladaptatus cibarius TaxID=453847 RepID=UPI0006789711|nr:PGF-CTERM sorting domain-containing protein [Haladaptatus cibarius]
MSHVEFSRRQFVQTMIGAGALVGVARGQAATFELGGQLSGWIGRAPDPIADETNPTIQMQAGKTYVIAWENMDGQPHNVAIADGEGNTLEETEVVNTKGYVQTLEFTAKPAMTTYFSQLDKESMRGKVEIVQPTTTATTNGTNNTTGATTATTTPPATTSSTLSATTTQSTAPSSTDTTTETTGSTEGGSLPGFGFLAALGGIAGVGYLLRRDD